jgi:hypothetical protein
MPVTATRTLKSSGKTEGLYSVHPSLAYAQAVLANMKVKTGRSLEEWVAFVKKEGPESETEQREWLKREHKLGTNYASWIAGRANGKGEDDIDPDVYLASAERYVEKMFGGKRAALRPIYDELLRLALLLGPDVKACPCQTMVPLYRRHAFLQIKPATNTRVDLGLCLRGVKTPKRLIDTGGQAKGDRITHRVAITSLDEIEDDVRRWMRKAYELAEPRE